MIFLADFKLIIVVFKNIFIFESYHLKTKKLFWQKTFYDFNRFFAINEFVIRTRI